MEIKGLFQRFQQKNWYRFLKSVLKVGDIMWTWNYIVRDILQVAVLKDHPTEATIRTDLSMALSLLDAALGALALARWSQAMFYTHSYKEFIMCSHSIIYLFSFWLLQPLTREPIQKAFNPWQGSCHRLTTQEGLISHCCGGTSWWWLEINWVITSLFW